MIIDEDAYLEHYGRKGMKWGVRRERQRAFQSPYKVKSVKRSELTGPQRRAIKFIEKNQRRGKTKKEIKVGNRAANKMLKQFGGMRIGSMWSPDNKYLEKLGQPAN